MVYEPQPYYSDKEKRKNTNNIQEDFRLDSRFVLRGIEVCYENALYKFTFDIDILTFDCIAVRE